MFCFTEINIVPTNLDIPEEESSSESDTHEIDEIEEGSNGEDDDKPMPYSVSESEGKKILIFSPVMWELREHKQQISIKTIFVFPFSEMWSRRTQILQRLLDECGLEVKECGKMDEFGYTKIEFISGTDESKMTSRIEPVILHDDDYKDALHHIILSTYPINLEYKGIQIFKILCGKKIDKINKPKYKIFP